jgi:chemosensory pili system protein ChpE
MKLFFVAGVMGLAFCGPPGAVFAMAARRGIANGFTAALMVEIGSLVGDAVWAVVGLSSVGILLQLASIQVGVATAGSLLLARLGVSALRDAWSDREPPAAPPSTRGDFATGAVLSLTNPQTLAYWIAFGATIEVIVGSPVGLAQLVIFFIGFMAGCLAFCFLAAAIISGARSLLTKNLYRVVNAICGITLLAFAILLVYDTYIRLRPH